MIFKALPRATIIFFKKEVYQYIFRKVIVTHGNTLENRKLCTYFTENILDDIQ